MGLDVLVYCDCHERGGLRSQPPTPVTVDSTGALVPSAQESERVAAFDRWRVDACEHPGGVRVRERLGNVAAIMGLRETLGRQSEDFPMLLQRVLYSGSHTGDLLDVPLFDAVEGELHRVGDLRHADAQEREHLLQFRERFGAVVRAARHVGKPIVF